MKASRIDSRAWATAAGSPSGTTWVSGTGSIQTASVRGGGERHVGVAGGSQVHRPGPALARAQHVEADVGRDPVQPRTQLGAALEAIERLPGAQEGLLHRVLGLE